MHSRNASHTKKSREAVRCPDGTEGVTLLHIPVVPARPDSARRGYRLLPAPSESRFDDPRHSPRSGRATSQRLRTPAGPGGCRAVSRGPGCSAQRYAGSRLPSPVPKGTAVRLTPAALPLLVYHRWSAAPKVQRCNGAVDGPARRRGSGRAIQQQRWRIGASPNARRQNIFKSLRKAGNQYSAGPQALSNCSIERDR